ncbi:hypothetical protein SDC9_129196 [bioreactor metagenome]|uniref:Uncharacterized protein n=1 Tax=bioreactor metagenome TaxID=1076179 RepID=A0A645CYZ0_9ZZZZ
MERRADVDIRRPIGKIGFKHGRTVGIVLDILRPNHRHRVEVDALQEAIVRAKIAVFTECGDAGLIAEPVFIVRRVVAVRVG